MIQSDPSRALCISLQPLCRLVDCFDGMINRQISLLGAELSMRSPGEEVGLLSEPGLGGLHPRTIVVSSQGCISPSGDAPVVRNAAIQPVPRVYLR